MQSYRFSQFGNLEHLELHQEDMPVPEAREVLIRVRATSLNYRDLAIMNGEYTLPASSGHIPLSDAAGEVIQIGKRVERFKVGDRVVNTFMPRWVGGAFQASARDELYGSDRDGWLTEYKVVSEESLLSLPDYLNFEQGATLPCAAVTAWAALNGDRPVKAGETVLTLGSGGVSLFAIQLAKAMGARIIATTSSEAKSAQLKALGADEVINYVQHPEWSEEVLRLTSGQGVNRVVEVGGPGTLNQSIRSICIGGELALIGFIARDAVAIDFFSLFKSAARFRVISVGSREDFEQMNRALVQHKIIPVIDSVFPFAEAKQAWLRFDSRQNVGKIVISH
ncbi:NAD(P)-dependent alcohol dehydrogenase [Yersinia intermedia]|jgi:NADPH:quinone reductase-like Zn-dependent oxidoreductase|uniref:zinc-dependent alcohol dehydrogenase family protein n=1 Tax=Yersinia intermedia TaxID=631 RepID=UPI000B646876|nr:NAD(P)-dependent alcohol dehydrogenase [Yersinia intermedia]MCW8110784.1 NAD(P)-dependent alcohol dehydrogenase [Yersinia intermedia]MDA5479886.1 NAD(P)-dependent alcohol dehydrogenase [Yersinia intermedia]MDA5515643.1 NAD(P)-dependent alcohol dehydrogenase [Yersinia intermedia]MDN0114826.1 NAD(P)-dependent alcohol dehydrogenase [Yersinia intermedia]OWF87377.1 alcohol dehydrogenase [Yersinia intermedia]